MSAVNMKRLWRLLGVIPVVIFSITLGWLFGEVFVSFATQYFNAAHATHMIIAFALLVISAAWYYMCTRKAYYYEMRERQEEVLKRLGGTDE